MSLVARVRLLLAFLAVSSALITVHATAGTLIQYTGRVSHDQARAVADGSYAFAFAIYDAAQGGLAVWEERHEAVAVKDGHYSVMLGSRSPLDVPDGGYWLETTIEGEPLSPRMALELAERADCSVDGNLDVTGNVGIGTAAPTESLEVIGNVKATSFIGDGSALTNVSIGDDVLDFSQLQDTLDLDATTKIDLGASDLDIDLSSTGDFRILEGGVAQHIFLDNGDVRLGNNNEIFIRTSDAAVGIGTSNPATKLGVDGTVTATGFSGDGAGLTNVAAATAKSIPRSGHFRAVVGPLAPSSGSQMVIGNDGLPLISVVAAPLGNAGLRVMHCESIDCSGPVGSSNVDVASTVVTQTAIAIGADGFALIAYRDTSGNVKTVHCTNTPCKTFDAPNIVDPSANTGAIALEIGVDGLGVVAYHKLLTDLAVGHCANTACSSFDATTIVDSASLVGAGCSLAIGTDGLPLISYFDDGSDDLKVVHCGDVFCDNSPANTVTSFDTVNAVGNDTSITIGSDGFGLISYRDINANNLKVLHCTNLPCSTASAPSTLDSAASVVDETSITIGSDGLGIISYHDGTNLKIAHCANLTCSTASTTVAVATANDVGEDSSIAIGVDGLPIVSYLDQTADQLQTIHLSNLLGIPHYRRR